MFNMKRERRRSRIHPLDQRGSADVDSVESFDVCSQSGFKTCNKILKETKECRPCEPEEIFDCLKVYFTILKAAGIYFENPREMEKIKEKQRERIRASMKKSFQDSAQLRTCDSKIGENEKRGDSSVATAHALFDVGMDMREKKRAGRRLLFSRIHRVYCTLLLLAHWTSTVRMISIFTPNDSFGPLLFFKMVAAGHVAMSSGMATSFYWACASGKFATVMIALSGLRGVDPDYLRNLGRTTCWICSFMLALNFGLILFGFFSLEWMYRPLGAPINTWIITEDETIQAISKTVTLLMLFFVPLASFLTSSFGMVYSLIIRRSIVFVRQDLKSYMACIQSVEDKKKTLSHPGTARSEGKTDSAMVEHLDVLRWQMSTPGKINSPFPDSDECQNSIQPGDALKLELKNNLTFEYLRQRFQFITKLIRRADKFLCVCNACGIVGYLSEVILLLYILLWYSCKFGDAWAYLATLSFWLLNAIVSLAYMCLSAVLVNNAAQRVFEKIHDVDLTRYPLEILNQFSIFLARMSTDSIGFTVLRLFVIDRNTILTVVGLFLTYFLLIYQLNPDNSSYCINLSKVGNDTLDIK